MIFARRAAIWVVLTCTAAATAVVVPAPPAHAALRSWRAHVVKVLDGDTLIVDVKGDSEDSFRVRFAGINAMETGTCHAAEATRVLRRRVEGKTVRLLARNAASEGLRSRKLRFVETLDGVDLGKVLVEKGLAFAFPNAQEPARNRTYMLRSRWAQRQGRNIWNPTDCRPGPRQHLPLKLEVMWNADGNDQQNLNGEWVRILNRGDADLPLRNWTLRDSALYRFKFPDGAKVPARSSLTVHMGKGTDTARRIHWGRSTSIFSDRGDGAYLIDPHNDVRAFQEWPCLGTTRCKDPIGSKLDLSVNFDPHGHDDDDPNREWANIRNVSSTNVDLTGYLVEAGDRTYELAGRTVLAPGERLRIHVGKGADSRLRRYWGRSTAIFPVAGSARIRTFTDKTAKRFEWPCTSCPDPDVRIDGIEVNPPGDDRLGGEWVRIRNYGDRSVNLLDWLLRDWEEEYHLGNVTLSPGESVTVHAGTGVDAGDDVFWGSTNLFANTAGSVVLRTQHRVKAHCFRWGGASCQS